MAQVLRHGGSCDFCSGSPGVFYRTGIETDICLNCAKTAYYQLGGIAPTPNNSANKVTLMLNALMKRLLDGDTQKLIKAGYLDKELNLTAAGEAEVMAIILEANKKDLVASAEAKIAEDKENK